VVSLEFIDVAERGGLLDTLLLKLLDAVAASLCHWPRRLAVNLSAGSSSTPACWTGWPPSCTRMACPCRACGWITETVLVQDHERALQTILAARQAGASLSLDDFGTGYSSLTRLQSYPFDEIKIDASFVRTMDQDPDKLPHRPGGGRTGPGLKMHVVAEGIETEHHAHLLKRMGCEFGQGFHLGRPSRCEAARLIGECGVWQRHGAGIDTSPFQRWHQLDSLYRSAGGIASSTRCCAWSAPMP
jgi:EAL domain-containing protein (putative c-di-GMP-specific phosphodiesterase class I)